MNKTYRILPSAEDMLLRLLRGLALTDEERALLRACVLRHVEVSAEENTWELVIGCSEVLDEGLIVRMKEQIAANYQLASAHIQQNAVSLAFEVKPQWERIVSAAAAGGVRRRWQRDPPFCPRYIRCGAVRAECRRKAHRDSGAHAHRLCLSGCLHGNRTRGSARTCVDTARDARRR